MREPALDRADPAGPLKIAFLGDPASIHMRRWVNYFAGRGHDVTMLMPRDWTVATGLLPSVKVTQFTRFAARGRLPVASFLRARRSLRRAIDEIRPDVLNAHYLTGNGWHAWMAGFHPYVITLWGSDVFLTPGLSRDFSLYGRLAVRAADMVMVNSEALRRGALDLGAADRRTEMIQWGVDLGRFHPGRDPVELRRRLGLKGRRVILSPRGLDPLYRQSVVLEALAQLPSDVVVLMTTRNPDPAHLESIRGSIARLGLADRVVLASDIADVEMPDLYRLADAVVSLPISDSTSAAMLESLASGRPVVAADLPSVREWLFDLDPRLLVPIDDGDATAAALLRVLDIDPDERATLAVRARAIVEERADESKCLARVESLYRQLAVRRSARR